MYKIKTHNKISPYGLNEFSDAYNVSDSVSDPDGIILRSYKMKDEDLVDSLQCIARAGAGVNNIPVEKCSEKGIVVFNTPGANANAVKELVITGLLLSGRKVVEGLNWIQTLKGTTGVAKAVEDNKAQFAGTELMGKSIGVIGLGAIGVMVANAAKSLKMNVLGYDPFISVDAAWSLSRDINKARDLKTILSECDYVTVHVPLNDATKGMFNAEAFGMMKDDAVLLNFSRADLVEENALKDSLESGKLRCYVTDFPDEKILDLPNIIPFPHLGASTAESEDNCAQMAAQELIDYLERGSILNSVNYPNCELGAVENGKIRICVVHENKPNLINPITNAVAKNNINIDNMVNKSKGGWAYTVMDIEDNEYQKYLDEIMKIDGVVRARAILG